MSKIALASLTALLAAACSGPAADGSTDEAELAHRKAAGDQPGQLQEVTFVGDGCDGGSATNGFSGDNQAFTALFSGFLTSVGDGTSPGDEARSCLLHVKVNVPSGWQYKLNAVDVRGFAGLDTGVTGLRQITYLSRGGRPVATPPVTFAGGAPAEDYSQRDVGPDSMAYKPCGGGQDLWIGVTLGLQSSDPAANGTLSIDSFDGELAWNRCP